MYIFVAAGKPAKGGKPVPEKAEEEPPEQEKKGVWTTTYPSGEKIQYKENVETEDLKPVMICVATDPETNQVSINNCRLKYLFCLYGAV